MKMGYCCFNNQRVGTCYFKFLKGKFANKYCRDTSICLSGDNFDGLNLYHIFVETVPVSDYHGITEIGREQWEQIKLTADSQDKMSIFHMLHNLSEPTREVMYLRLSRELSFREIGELLNQSETWARVTFYRGKKKLMEGLE